MGKNYVTDTWVYNRTIELAMEKNPEKTKELISINDFKWICKIVWPFPPTIMGMMGNILYRWWEMNRMLKKEMENINY